MIRFPTLPLALLLLFSVSVTAGEQRTIELPRAALSLDVPNDWSIEQYGDALLELRSGKTVVWVRRHDKPAPRGTRTWSDVPEGGARCMDGIGPGPTSVFWVEAHVPDAKQREVVDGVLDSIVVSPYVHATRHVDWGAGWTLDLPEGWERSRVMPGVARFDEVGGDARLWIEPMDGLLETEGGADAAWQLGLQRIQEELGVTAEGMPMTEVLRVGERDARRMHLGLDLDEEGRPRAWMHVFVVDGWRLLAFTREGKGGEADALREAMRSFRRETSPGPRVSMQDPTDHFPGDKGPAVVFALPAGWKVTPGSNSMRLAQVELPDADGVDALVFFFGVGGGGSLEGNLDRWRGQMGNEDGGTVETFEPAEDVKITLLDVTGAYQTSRMNPHGADPHGNPHGGGGASDASRMLGAIVEVPGGPLFVKVVGPEDAVAKVAEDVTTWLLSFRPER